MAAAEPTKRTGKKKSGRPLKPWQEPDGYRDGLVDHVERLRAFLFNSANDDMVVMLTYAKRADREGLKIRSLTGEVLSLLERHNTTRAVEWPLWPAAYVPCAPNGRALHYMCEAEMKVLRELMQALVSKLRERLDAGKCLVMGLCAARLVGGFAELRSFVVANKVGAEPGHGSCCLSHPSEWHKLHGEALAPVHSKLAGVFGEEFPDLKTFERRINGAYRRARISVGLYVQRNVSDEKREEFSNKLKAAWAGNDARKEELSRLSKDRWATRRDEFVSKLKESLAKPETRSRKSESAKEMWKKPEQREKRAKHFHDAKNQQARRDGFKTMSKEATQSHADNVSAARRKMNGLPDQENIPAAFSVRIPIRLDATERARIVGILDHHHSEVVADPNVDGTYWALSRHNSAKRAGPPVREELKKMGVTAVEMAALGRPWCCMHPVEAHPANRTSSATEEAAAASAYRVRIPTRLDAVQRGAFLAFMKGRYEDAVSDPDLDGIYWGVTRNSNPSKAEAAVREFLKKFGVTPAERKKQGKHNQWMLPVDQHPARRSMNSSSSSATPAFS